jgi:hypothetical protein
MIIEGKPGPLVLGDGSTATVRLGKDGGLTTQDAHSRYYEPTYRGNVYWLDSGTITLAAANTSAGALGTESLINGFYNPPGSGKNAVILSVAVTFTSGTPTGAIVYNYLNGVVLSNAVTGTIRNALLGISVNSAMQAEVNVVLASNTPTATAALIQLGVVGLQGAKVATPTGIYEEVAGRIIVPPGCVFGLAQIGASTAVVQSTISWEEAAI